MGTRAWECWKPGLIYFIRAGANLESMTILMWKGQKAQEWGKKLHG